MKSIYSFCLVILVVIFGTTFCSSCSEADETPISVWFSSSMPKVLTSGMRVNVVAQLCSSNSENIKSYSVVFDDGRNDVLLKEEELGGLDSYYIDFNSEVPFIQDDSVDCRIKINVRGVNGFSSTISHHVKVYGAIKDNAAGFKLYAAISGKKNGFYLSDLSSTYARDLTDSLDVYFHYDCLQDQWEKYCEGWRTDSRYVKFVRANNYDYSRATAGNLQTVFESSNKTVSVENIKAGDIIIVGYKDKPVVVFNCLAYDDDSKLYTFSYKSVATTGLFQNDN